MDAKKAADLHLESLLAINRACQTIPGEEGEERTAAIISALCQCFAGAYCDSRHIPYTDDGQAEDAANAAYRGLQVWADKELELRKTGKAITQMLTPPPEQHRLGNRVRRVARVVLTWNNERQEWDADEPSGISNYVEPLTVQ